MQVPIFDLLKKFDNQHTSDDIKAGRRRFKLTKLPSYMVVHIKRFTKNNFFVEKNPTIVNFPVKNLELRDVVPVPSGRVTPISPSCLMGQLCSALCVTCFKFQQGHIQVAALLSWTGIAMIGSHRMSNAVQKQITHDVHMTPWLQFLN